jgi:hypothetical protein
MAVGFLLSWLVAKGFLDESTSMEAATAISAGLTALLGGIYYFIVRFAAEKFPWVGVFLGYNKAPSYNAPTE